MPPELLLPRAAYGESSETPLSPQVQRVLFVTNMYPVSKRPAFGIIVERLARALEEKGLTIEVECVSCGRGSADYFLARRRIARAARSFGPDVVHIHFGYTALATSSAFPRVVSFYGDDLNGESIGNGARITVKSRVGVALSRRAAKRCERSIAVSESLRARIVDPEARQRCVVIRDSVDARLFSPGRREEARARLGIALDAELVLFPHSLGQRTKRVDLARAAVERLKQVRPRAELWVVNGQKPNDMPDVYRAANALIVTSDLEGGPSCVKEALACGLPVVSVPVGDLRVLEEAAPLSALVPRDPDLLAAALAQAIEKPAGERSGLPEELTLARSTRRILEVYENARQTHAADQARARQGGAN